MDNDIYVYLSLCKNTFRSRPPAELPMQRCAAGACRRSVRARRHELEDDGIHLPCSRDFGRHGLLVAPTNRGEASGGEGATQEDNTGSGTSLSSSTEARRTHAEAEPCRPNLLERTAPAGDDSSFAWTLERPAGGSTGHGRKREPRARTLGTSGSTSVRSGRDAT